MLFTLIAPALAGPLDSTDAGTLSAGTAQLEVLALGGPTLAAGLGLHDRLDLMVALEADGGAAGQVGVKIGLTDLGAVELAVDPVTGTPAAVAALSLAALHLNLGFDGDAPLAAIGLEPLADRRLRPLASLLVQPQTPAQGVLGISGLLGEALSLDSGLAVRADRQRQLRLGLTWTGTVLAP
jgi:hypothetical protein